MNKMKSRLLFFDLAICSLWMLSVLGGRYSWTYNNLPFIVLAVFYRVVVSFSLYHQEKRTWLPLLVFMPLAFFSAIYGVHNGISDSVDRLYELTNLEYNETLKYVIVGFFIVWLFIVPYLGYLILLPEKWLVRTDLTRKELLGGILWHGRLEKTVSAIMMVMLTAFLTGLNMSPRLCQLMCLTAAPLTYWLLCHYYGIKAEKIWVLAVAMVVFCYAQLFGGVWRASMLLVSFGLVVYVCTRLYKNTKRYLLANFFALYMGILLPSFAIGYNQYACINYARGGFYYLEPFHGILFITDKTGELYGLRDRYGLLVEPIYERIETRDQFPHEWAYIYAMKKDGYTRYYDVCNNQFTHEPDIRPELQREVRSIIENHFKSIENGYDDKGQITITNLTDDKTIANVRVSMYGNPFLNYENDHFIPDDNVDASADGFFRNDSVPVYHSTKRSLSYTTTVPDDAPTYRIYVRLATDSLPDGSTLIGLARQVASLPELMK